jgi:CubicO group peptidase (beta-lactamase class C family)
VLGQLSASPRETESSRETDGRLADWCQHVTLGATGQTKRIPPLSHLEHPIIHFIEHTMRLRTSTLALALIGALGQPCSLAAQAVPPRFAAVADSLRRLVDSAHVAPSITVAVIGRDGIVWEQGFGYANVERGVRAEPTTSYPAASVAKSFTAVGVLRAVERHRLDLDKPVADYLGASAVQVRIGDADKLTTRRLLQMTAGIPHLVRFHWPDAPEDTMVHGPLARFAAFPPGAGFHYSNASLGIAGEVAARVASLPFDEYMRREVFAPLGLSSTAVRGDALPEARVAQTYSPGPFHRLGFVRLDPEPGAGVFTSAHDLALLARALFLAPDRAFLGDSSRASLLHFDGFYSLGWWRDPFHSGEAMPVADGAAYGHQATLKVYPAHGIAVAVLTNGSVREGFTLELCDFVLAAADSAYPKAQPIPASFFPKPLAGDSSFAGEWTGRVSLPHGAVPVRFIVPADGKARGVVGEDTLAVVRDAEVNGGLLEADIAGAMPQAETAGQPNTLGIRLRRVGPVLAGYVNAQVKLGDRPFLMLPFAVCLWRTDGGTPVDRTAPSRCGSSE